MKHLFLFLAMLMGLTYGIQAQAPKVYDEDIDAMEQIQKAVEEARASDRYVMCQVGGNWCPWCLRFAEFAANDSVIAPLMKENYVVSFKDFARIGVPFTLAAVCVSYVFLWFVWG